MSSDPTHPTCEDGSQDLLAQLEAYLDGELDAAQQHELERHIADCYPCADRATFERRLRALVQSSCLEAAPATLRQRILKHVHEDTSA